MFAHVNRQAEYLAEAFKLSSNFTEECLYSLGDEVVTAKILPLFVEKGWSYVVRHALRNDLNIYDAVVEIINLLEIATLESSGQSNQN